MCDEKNTVVFSYIANKITSIFPNFSQKCLHTSVSHKITTLLSSLVLYYLVNDDIMLMQKAILLIR